jgi:hypothetical protein
VLLEVAAPRVLWLPQKGALIISRPVKRLGVKRPGFAQTLFPRVPQAISCNSHTPEVKLLILTRHLLAQVEIVPSQTVQETAVV